MTCRSSSEPVGRDELCPWRYSMECPSFGTRRANEERVQWARHRERWWPKDKRSWRTETLLEVTNWAFFFSINDVTVFIPLRRPLGRFVGRSGLSDLACSSARCFKRSFFSARLSGRYFSSNLNNCVEVCLSSVWVNWLIGGGTFKRFNKMLRWRWTRMYWGHLTKRVRSRLCWMSKRRVGEVIDAKNVLSAYLVQCRSSSVVSHRVDWQLFYCRPWPSMARQRSSSCLSSTLHRWTTIYWLSSWLWWSSFSSPWSYLLWQVTSFRLIGIELFNLEYRWGSIVE